MLLLVFVTVVSVIAGGAAEAQAAGRAAQSLADGDTLPTSPQADPLAEEVPDDGDSDDVDDAWVIPDCLGALLPGVNVVAVVPPHDGENDGLLRRLHRPPSR